MVSKVTSRPKRWTGRINGFKVNFFQDAHRYTAAIFPFASMKQTATQIREAGEDIRKSSIAIGAHRDDTELDATWSHAFIAWSFRGACDAKMTKRFAVALDVAWRVASGIEEELGVTR